VQPSETFLLGGELPVRRLGYGTAQLTGPGYWGPRGAARDAVAVLVEPGVPVAGALAAARELRAESGPARVVETVRRSGKFGAQLGRLEAAGFSAFVVVSLTDGAVVRGELRTLGS